MRPPKIKLQHTYATFIPTKGSVHKMNIFLQKGSRIKTLNIIFKQKLQSNY